MYIYIYIWQYAVNAYNLPDGGCLVIPGDCIINNFKTAKTTPSFNSVDCSVLFRTLLFRENKIGNWQQFKNILGHICEFLWNFEVSWGGGQFALKVSGMVWELNHDSLMFGTLSEAITYRSRRDFRLSISLIGRVHLETLSIHTFTLLFGAFWNTVVNTTTAYVFRMFSCVPKYCQIIVWKHAIAEKLSVPGMSSYFDVFPRSLSTTLWLRNNSNSVNPQLTQWQHIQ
jgi:hypothetical protein